MIWTHPPYSLKKALPCAREPLKTNLLDRPGIFWRVFSERHFSEQLPARHALGRGLLLLGLPGKQAPGEIQKRGRVRGWGERAQGGELSAGSRGRAGKERVAPLKQRGHSTALEQHVPKGRATTRAQKLAFKFFVF